MSEAYNQIKKNSVSSKNQLKDSQYVRFLTPEASGVRVLFVGNSITLHGVSPSIGWHGEWGMAASEKAKDYVHLMMDKIDELLPHTRYAICQVAEWEHLL